MTGTYKWKYLGYFNDANGVDDIPSMTPGELIYEMGCSGRFFKATEERNRVFCKEDIYRTDVVKSNSGNLYLLDRDFTDRENPENNFIDVYIRVMYTDEELGDPCKGEKSYEGCHWCGEESEMPTSLGVYRCKNCGRWIVNCGMCPLLEKGNCVKPCPLEEEAKIRNKAEGFE